MPAQAAQSVAGGNARRRPSVFAWVGLIALGIAVVCVIYAAARAALLPSGLDDGPVPSASSTSPPVATGAPSDGGGATEEPGASASADPAETDKATETAGPTDEASGKADADKASGLPTPLKDRTDLTPEEKAAIEDPHGTDYSGVVPQRDADGNPLIYLTFDDGPSEFTPRVLEQLDTVDAKATFFMIGANAEAHKDQLQAVRDHGHAVGNHTWHHPDLVRRSNDKVQREIDRTEEQLGATTCVRPPYGSTSSRVRSLISEGGRVQVLWTLDTLDWKQPGAEKIADTVLKNAHPGTVVLMHDGGGKREQEIEALKIMLPKLKEQGYRFATLPACA